MKQTILGFFIAFGCMCVVLPTIQRVNSVAPVNSVTPVNSITPVNSVTPVNSISQVYANVQVHSPIKVEFNRATLLVLSGEDHNPVGFVRIEKSGELRMTRISFDMKGTTDLNDVEGISLFECNQRGQIKSSGLIAVMNWQPADYTSNNELSSTLKNKLSNTSKNELSSTLKNKLSNTSKNELSSTLKNKLSNNSKNKLSNTSNNKLSSSSITLVDGSSSIAGFRLNVPLQSDTTYWAFTVKLKKGALLSNRINLNCTGIAFDREEIELLPVFAEGLRVGIALRKHKQDGVHTSRIPGLITTKKGTLLAVYDARWDSSRDLQGDMDIAMNRSEDGGQSWQPMQVILDMEEWGALPEKFNGVSDACILVDEKKGDIYLAGLWMHGVLDRATGQWIEGLTENSTQWIHQWHAKGSQPGLGVKETSQFLITKSTDDGMTWSEPVNITARTKKPEWWLYAPAPGHGITLKDGTLVFPTQGRDHNGHPFSNISYSKDGGKTWIASNPAYTNTTESMAVELNDGSIMLNMRDNRNYGVVSPNGRRICVTYDLGATWTEHPTSHTTLTESTCMASLHKHYFTKNRKQQSLLAFFNPNSHNSRTKLTLKLSLDEGATWPSGYWLMLDEWGGFGYSCITSIDENTLGIVYEGSRAQLIFQQVRLDEILK